MSLINIEDEQYRRDILQLLEQDSDYAMSEVILMRALQDLGNPIARDRLQTQLHWLKEQALIKLDTLGDSVILTAKLTARGSDVANGRCTVPHIARLALE